MIRRFEEEWGTTDLEGYFYQQNIVQGIVMSPVSSVRKCMTMEHYFYLYGAVWGLNLREVTSVSLISLMHVYESLIGARYLGKCNLREKFMVTDVAYYGPLVEKEPGERFFLTVPLIESRLCRLSREIPDKEPLRKFQELLQHPLCPILLAAVSIDNKIALAKFFMEKRQTQLFSDLYQLTTLEEVIEKYSIFTPYGVSKAEYIRNNILHLTQKPFTRDLIAGEGYLPAHSSVRELREIYRNKDPCYQIRDKKFVCGIEAPSNRDKAYTHYLGVNVEVRVKQAHEGQVSSVRNHFPVKSEHLKKYVHALYRMCLVARGGGTCVNEAMFVNIDSEESDYYFQKLSEEEQGFVESFPLFTSFFTQESVSHRNRFNKNSMLSVFYTCCIMMLVLDIPCPVDICRIEYLI